MAGICSGWDFGRNCLKPMPFITFWMLNLNGRSKDMIIKLFVLAVIQSVVVLFGIGVPTPIVIVGHLIVFLVWSILVTKY